MEKRVTVMHMVDCLNIGGGEMQMVDLLRRIDRDKFRPIVGCLRKEGPLLSALEQIEIPVREIPVRGALYYPHSIREMIRLSFFLRKEKVKILHTQDLYSHLVGVPAAILASVPIVITNRLDLGHTMDRWHRWALRALSPFITKLMANSEGVRRMLITAEKTSPEKIEVIYNGVDLERFDRGAEIQARRAVRREPLYPDFHPEDRLIGVLANLSPIKGHAVLLEAAVRIIAYCPKAKLIFIGREDCRPALEARARALSIDKRVVFLGSRQDVPRVLSCLEISVLPSLAEGFSNAILESMAAGLPMVATDVGGNREAIVEGETGFLVPPKDPDALADRILRLLEDRTLAEKFGKAGRRRIEEFFTLDRMVSETERFYEELLGNGRVNEEPVHTWDDSFSKKTERVN